MDYGTLVGLLLSLVALGAAGERNPKAAASCPDGLHRLPTAQARDSQGRQHQARALPHRQALKPSSAPDECSNVVQSD